MNWRKDEVRPIVNQIYRVKCVWKIEEDLETN